MRFENIHHSLPALIFKLLNPDSEIVMDSFIDAYSLRISFSSISIVRLKAKSEKKFELIIYPPWLEILPFNSSMALFLSCSVKTCQFNFRITY